MKKRQVNIAFDADMLEKLDRLALVLRADTGERITIHDLIRHAVYERLIKDTPRIEVTVTMDKA